MEIELIIDSETKTCTQCKETYPATEEFFYKQKTHTKKNGTFYKLSTWCRECQLNNSKQYRIDNLEDVKAYDKFRYRKKEDYYKDKAKRWNTENEDKKKINYKKWQEENKEKLFVYGKNRRMNKEHEISETEWFECLDFFNNKCAYCGISEGEAYEKYDQLLHKEHVEHDGANDITNCVPSCKGCNGSKHLFSLNDWYKESNPVYSKRRYNKIVKWLMSFTTESK